MKKIYSKITKERQKEFQIETYIAVQDGKQYVAKRALHAEAYPHVRAMAEYYQRCQEAGNVCPSAMQGNDTIVFDYLEGKSLCRELLDALRGKNREQFFALLGNYTEFVANTVDAEQVTFAGGENSDWKPEFEKVFGQSELSGEYMCGRNLNIDLTFDNIIKTEADENYRMIDYEWLFPFPVPLKFVYYRAAYAFYVRYGSRMKELLTQQELLDYFALSEEEIRVFEHMNVSFNAYVYGGENGYNQITKAYRHTIYDVKKLLPEENLFFQLFLNDGMAYLEDKAITRGLSGKEIELVIPLKLSEEIKEIRIDPINVSGILKNLKIEVKAGDTEWSEVTEYRHNAILFEETNWIFCSEDPQVIFENQWENSEVDVKTQFTIVEAGMQENPALAALMQQKEELQKKQDELTLIKNSRIYQKLMAKKIDKLLGENQ